MLQKHAPRSRLVLEWALELSEFQFTVSHIRSKNNEIADALSRIYTVTAISRLSPEVSINELISVQASDPQTNAAISNLSSGKKGFDVSQLGSLKRHRRHLRMERGLLVWKTLPVIPLQLQSRILQTCHDHPMSGHFKLERTWKRFRSSYFWPNAKADVHKWVMSCHQCQQFDPPSGGYTNLPLKPIESSNRFELVCFDLAGPFLPSTPRGNTYALIIVDHFSKWPELIALKDSKAATIARAIFENWCCRYGIMDRLHSDGGQNVDGNVVRELCKLIGTVKSHSSRLHPQGDGMAEAVVKLAKSCIKKQIDLYGSDWDLYLPATAFAIRSSVSTSTGLSPAELILGSTLKKPIDHLIELPDRVSNHQLQAHEFAKELKFSISNATSLVNDNLTHHRSAMKAKYDKTSRARTFETGQYVMLRWPYQKKGIPGSFQPRWRGPCKIQNILSPTNCSIIDPDGKVFNVHFNQLKQCQARQIGKMANFSSTNEPCDDNISVSNIDYTFDDLESPPANRINRNQPYNTITNENENVAPKSPSNQQQTLMGASWTDLDDNNIIEGTRSRKPTANFYCNGKY